MTRLSDSPSPVATSPPAAAEVDGRQAVHPLIRWPARVIALVVVLPLRLLWDGFGAAGLLVERLWERLVTRPLKALGRSLLRLLGPIGRGLAAPWRWFQEYVARPITIAFDWLWRRLVLAPTLALWRRLFRPFHLHFLAPIGRAVTWLWRSAGVALATLGRMSVVPLSWVHRRVLLPGGRALRAGWRAATRPILPFVRPFVRQARDAAREVSSQVRRAFRRG